MKTEPLSIDLLTIDKGTQVRVKISEETVEDYAAKLEGSKGWPFDKPIVVFHDGTDYLVADGFHRTLAAQRVNRASVPCEVRKGTARDAVIFGMTANDTHGLRMSRADKRKCVEWLLDNGGKMTQEKVAETAGVTRQTVSRIVAERKPENVTLLHSEKPKPPSKPPEQVAESTELMREVVETAKATAQRTGQPVVSRIAVDHDEPEVSEKSSASIVWDALDREIPQKFRAANELSITLMSVGRDVDKFRQRAKELSEQPGGEWIRLQEIDEHVRALKGHFQEARYHTVCHQCKGKGCQKCEQNGWVPEFRKNTVL